MNFHIWRFIITKRKTIWTGTHGRLRLAERGPYNSTRTTCYHTLVLNQTYLQLIEDTSAVVCWDVISNSNDNAIIAPVTEGDWARMSGASIPQEQIQHQQTNCHWTAGQWVHLLLCQNVTFQNLRYFRLTLCSSLHYDDSPTRHKSQATALGYCFYANMSNGTGYHDDGNNNPVKRKLQRFLLRFWALETETWDEIALQYWLLLIKVHRFTPFVF